MKLSKLDNQLLGFIVGLIAPLIGVYVYYKIIRLDMDFSTFVNLVREMNLTSKVLSLGALANLAVFLIFISLKLDKFSRGIVIATFVYAVIILIFRFIV